MSALNNGLKANDITLLDKVKKLLEKPYKLVLVQQHELEMLRTHKSRSKYSFYIENLYKHYIIDGGSKTYINN